MWVDYWGGGANGMLAPPSQIIGGPCPPLPTPMDYGIGVDMIIGSDNVVHPLTYRQKKLSLIHCATRAPLGLSKLFKLVFGPELFLYFASNI